MGLGTKVKCVNGGMEWQVDAWYDVELELHEIDEKTEVHTCFNDSVAFARTQTRVLCATRREGTTARSAVDVI